MDAKFFTYIHVIHPVVKRMAARGSGVIVNVIGNGGKVAAPIHLAAGGATNAALMLVVWSRDEVVRVDFEGCWVLCPGLADRLEGGSPSQPLEVLGEVVGRDEGQDMSLQALQV